jgi:hypothetical protein
MSLRLLHVISLELLHGYWLSFVWRGYAKAVRLISKIRITFHQVQQCFSNKIKHLHVSANDGHYRKATNTSKEMLHTYITCMLSCMGYTST